MGDIILLLRGHIRDLFKDKKLYDFIYELSNKYPLKVYIHTWNKYASNLSWRNIDENNDLVDKDTILSYFSGMTEIIASITIDDDSFIELVGDIDGYVFSTKLPKIAWKRMWYGIYKLSSEINTVTTDSPLVINTRFDVFNNSNSINNETVLWNFIDECVKMRLTKNLFLYGSTQLIGIDNFYAGTPETMLTLSENFHKNLDDINRRYKDIYFQEVTVYYENNRLFGETNYENIDIYYKQNFIQNNKDVVTVREEDNREKMTFKTNLKKNITFNNASAIQRPIRNLNHVTYFKPAPARPTPAMTPRHTTTNWGSFTKK